MERQRNCDSRYPRLQSRARQIVGIQQTLRGQRVAIEKALSAAKDVKETATTQRAKRIVCSVVSGYGSWFALGP